MAIPRGGRSLIKRGTAEATMPVLKHFDGVCHVYVDATAELPGMIEIIEMNQGQEAMYARFRAAALAWDGTDPVREG